MGIPDDGARWGGIALAHNVRSRDEVARVIEQARSNGATITREPSETFYGGYAGVFLDLDGHAWEIAHNPGFGLDDAGNVVLRATSEASRSMPSSIGASSTMLNDRRTLSAPRPSGKNSEPGTIPTPALDGALGEDRRVAAAGSVSQEKKPPRGRRPAHAVGHRRARARRASARTCAGTARARRELLVDPAAAHVLLEQPLAERAGALVGVLLRRDELRRDLAGADRPAEPHAGEERLRRRSRLDDHVRARATRGSGALRRRSRARGRRRPRR